MQCLDIIREYFKITNYNSDGHFDIIGHAYCIALLSQTKYNRENTINYLNKCADILIKNNEQGYGLAMYRNMKTLSKEYPDLKNLEKKLQCFKDYDYWCNWICILYSKNIIIYNIKKLQFSN